MAGTWRTCGSFDTSIQTEVTRTFVGGNGIEVSAGVAGLSYFASWLVGARAGSSADWRLLPGCSPRRLRPTATADSRRCRRPAAICSTSREFGFPVDVGSVSPPIVWVFPADSVPTADDAEELPDRSELEMAFHADSAAVITKEAMINPPTPSLSLCLDTMSTPIPVFWPGWRPFEPQGDAKRCTSKRYHSLRVTWPVANPPAHTGLPRVVGSAIRASVVRGPRLGRRGA